MDVKEPVFYSADVENPVGADEYTSWWGCDPQYDRSPRERGDGYLFYNFSQEKHSSIFLKKFIPAIKRTIRLCRKENNPTDAQDLTRLLKYVQQLYLAC